MRGNECPIHVADGVLGKQCHVCAFFNGFDEQHRVLRSFIKEGFERGDKAFHIVDPELREDHLKRLAEAGIDVEQAMATGTKDDPWVLKTPPGSSEYTIYRDETADPPQLVCQVGSTKLTYLSRAVEDLHGWLQEQGDWIPLGAADEQKTPAEGTVEAWGRSADNPVGGWYGLRKGYRGRFGMYLPPLLEELGLAEVTHDARNNKMQAKA